MQTKQNGIIDCKISRLKVNNWYEDLTNHRLNS